ncbi:MAG: DMT family transporter [Spirochaetia bacterium]|jgi:drug/metabolite transporter (DMT)-like permease|nr:DMT family transporter [Spirochaetia bacterium]
MNHQTRTPTANKNLSVASASQATSGGTLWITLALVSHATWGSYSVFARYLQNRHHLGALSLAALANALAFCLLALFTRKKLNLKSLPAKEIIIYAAIVIGRNLLNLYAARYTYATNVQLMSLLAPFIVAYISRIFLKETLPPKTKPALLLCFLGSIFMILGGQGDVQPKDRLSNWLGIGLSLLAGVFLAVLMLEIKRLSRKGATAETLAFYQFGPLSGFMLLASLTINENWQPWTNLALPGMLAFLCFALVVLLLGTVLQNKGVEKLGAPAYTTIQASRLVAAILFSWLLLGEGIQSLAQAFGALIVIATITWYTLPEKSR